MLGCLGPRALRLAARYADIWSAYGDKRTDVLELGPRIADFEAACADVGRDPSTVRRSAGIYVEVDKDEVDPSGASISGKPDQVADAILALRDAGYTQVEIWLLSFSAAAADALAAVVDLVRAARA